MNEDEFDKALENVARLATTSEVKVEPSAVDRSMAQAIRQSYIAYRDEGFDRGEALALASMPMREIVRYDCERREREEGGQ